MSCDSLCKPGSHSDACLQDRRVPINDDQMWIPGFQPIPLVEIEPHPWYGPCDGLGLRGGCSECTGKIEADEALPKPKGLPTDDAARKELPIFRGPLLYFPDALLEVARVCKQGNDQHNPGQPMHWAREKSPEQLDCAVRHLIDHGVGNLRDTDGMLHLAKAAWRILAELQLTIERSR